MSKLKEKYLGKEALILEFVKPRKSMETHALDILTIRRNDGTVKILTCIYWGNCSENTTHSTRSGYMVDVATGNLLKSICWYCAGFKDTEAEVPDEASLGELFKQPYWGPGLPDLYLHITFLNC